MSILNIFKKTPAVRQEMIYINGEWRERGIRFNVVSPASGDIIAEVAQASTEEAYEVCEAAYLKKVEIANMPAYKRGEILKKVSEKLKVNSEKFAQLITEESGKPITDSRGEVKASIERLDFGVEEAHRLFGEAGRGDNVASSATKIGMTIRLPIGIVLAICPFNYPLYIPISKIAPAIAAGNAVILKPASADPTPAIRLAKLFEEAGLPPGVLQVICGGGNIIGNILVSHPKINMISFTGNTKTGEEIARSAVFAKLHMELGGKSPALVIPPVKLEMAAKECVKGAFKFSGQRCDAISRIIVVENIYDEFLVKLTQIALKWKMGDPNDEKTEMGPLISEEAIKKVTDLVNEAVNLGARVIIGGKRKEGLYFEPTVLADVNPKMRIAWEETFGPVAAVMKVKDYPEALQLANKSEFGLDASIFTDDINIAMDAATKLESGTVQINGSPAHGVGNFLYGGDESSGMGREGIFISAEEMTKMHTVVFNPA